MPNHVSIGQYVLEDLNHPSACLHGCEACAEANQKAGFPMVSQGTGYFSIPALLVLGIPHFKDFMPLILYPGCSSCLPAALIDTCPIKMSFTSLPKTSSDTGGEK